MDRTTCRACPLGKWRESVGWRHPQSAITSRPACFRKRCGSADSVATALKRSGDCVFCRWRVRPALALPRHARSSRDSRHPRRQRSAGEHLPNASWWRSRRRWCDCGVCGPCWSQAFVVSVSASRIAHGSSLRRRLFTRQGDECLQGRRKEQTSGNFYAAKLADGSGAAQLRFSAPCWKRSRSRATRP